MRRLLYHSAWLLALGCLLLPAQSYWQSRDSTYNQSIAASGGSVAFQDTCTENHSLSFPASYTGLTVTAGLTNPAILATLGFSAPVTAVTVVWDLVGANQVLTRIVTASGGVGSQVDLWGLVSSSPIATLNKTLTVTWVGGGAASICAVTWTGVNTASVAAGFPNSNSATGSSTAPSVTITSASGHGVMALHEANTAVPNMSSVNNTQVFLTNAFARAIASNRAAGAGSVAMSGTLDASAAWVSVGTDISP